MSDTPEASPSPQKPDPFDEVLDRLIGEPESPATGQAMIDYAKKSVGEPATFPGMTEARAAWLALHQAINTIEAGVAGCAPGSATGGVCTQLGEVLHGAMHAEARLNALVPLFAQDAAGVYGDAAQVAGQLSLELGLLRVQAVCVCPHCVENRTAKGAT